MSFTFSTMLIIRIGVSTFLSAVETANHPIHHIYTQIYSSHKKAIFLLLTQFPTFVRFYFKKICYFPTIILTASKIYYDIRLHL